MLGPIATEVIEGLSSPGHPIPIKADEPLPVRPIHPVPITQEAGSKPLDVISRNIPRQFSAAWWFEKGGPVGVMCFAFLAAAYWMADSQKSSQSALVQSLQESNKAANAERQEIIRVLLTTQAEISANMARMAKSIERIEARVEKKD